MTAVLGGLIVLLAVSGLCGLYRVFRGPEQLDRVLALDYLSIVGIAVVVLLAVTTEEPLVLDVGICFALVGFLTAYVLAKFDSKKGH